MSEESRDGAANGEEQDRRSGDERRQGEDRRKESRGVWNIPVLKLLVDRRRGGDRRTGAERRRN